MTLWVMKMCYLLNRNCSSEQERVSKVIVHQKYGTNYIYQGDDIPLFKLTCPAHKSATVDLARLNTDSTLEEPGTECYVAG